jgi:hypothetical protein
MNQPGAAADARHYERGHTPASGRSSLTPKPVVRGAIRCPRIEAVGENLTRPSRILLTELVAGLPTVEHIDLADAEEAKLGDRRFVTRVRLRWRSASNPLARAAPAAGAHLQVLGVELATVALMPRSVLDEQQNRWAVDCRETHLRDLVVYLGYKRIADGLFNLHPERKRPLRAFDSPPRPGGSADRRHRGLAVAARTADRSNRIADTPGSRPSGGPMRIRSRLPHAAPIRTRTPETTILSRAAASLEPPRKSCTSWLFFLVPSGRQISAKSGRLVAVWEMEAGASPNRRALGGGAR